MYFKLVMTCVDFRVSFLYVLKFGILDRFSFGGHVFIGDPSAWYIFL
jgi:hypothetical protein